MRRWYVINTQPNQEVRAELNLRRQGYHVWFPFIMKNRRHARKVERVKAPFFPGYLFVSLDLESELWSPIQGTYGVRNLVCNQGRPASIPTPFVENLLASTGDEGALCAPEPEWVPGQKLKVSEGPFAENVATLVKLASKERVLVMINLLGREVSAFVSRSQVAAAT